MSSLCARFSFLSLCEIFYVNLFVCKKSMHDFLWHQHKMIILRTTQNWWKRPYIASGWALDTLKKVVEHCCRNCRFLGGVLVGMAYEWQLWLLCHKGPTLPPPQTMGIFHILTKGPSLFCVPFQQESQSQADTLIF